MEEPLIPEDLIWIIEAFNQLTIYRQVGLHGVGPIGLQEIYTYAIYYNLTDKEKEYLLPCITAMDAVYLENNQKDKKDGSEI